MRLPSVDKASMASKGMLLEKKRPFQCLDEFNAFDDEEEDEHAPSTTTNMQYLSTITSCFGDASPQTCTSFKAVRGARN